MLPALRLAGSGVNEKTWIFNIAILFWMIAAEVLVINASSKAQNQPLSFDVVEAVSSQ
ncbi:hypothetical protein [Endozoicomonas sp. GU-1]|uniref:hypothetical protein n=1 Tax=Endozoicomonas sp. GU-1 TaxID=3009078 RepID=UPI0022B363C8|nr:hypothetical protein [Endozoicomonas sp. GU-1]WBA82596.1 hypothetical protein O2T12_05485 [Endozoicomonas sp. GU-1]WBA85525.1 hypothetical protein O3276_20140 [Endozoicomonas sp. GU-1]